MTFIKPQKSHLVKEPAFQKRPAAGETESQSESRKYKSQMRY